MSNNNYYLVFEGETLEAAVKHHSRPFHSTDEATEQANTFNEPGRFYGIYELESRTYTYHGVTKQ